MSNIENEIDPNRGIDIDAAEVELAKLEIMEAAQAAADIIFTSSFDHKCYLDYTQKHKNYKVYISVEPIE